MNLRASMMAGVARQLALPHGVRGRLVGAMLNRANRANRAAVAAAVKALPVTDGDTVAVVLETRRHGTFAAHCAKLPVPPGSPGVSLS